MTHSEVNKVQDQARTELARISEAKRAEYWSARDAQKQLVSNALAGVVVSRAQRAAVYAAMKGRPLAHLGIVLGEVLRGS